MERYIVKVNKIVACDQLEVMENNGPLIGDGRVQKIYDDISQAEIPKQTDIIDYGGRVIIPGVTGCHNHLAPDVRLEDRLARMEDCGTGQTIRTIKTMKDNLAAGVTTSRYLGNRFYIDVTCKKAQKEGRIAGPRLAINGIDMRNSHGYGYVGVPYYGAGNFRRTSGEDITRGVDFLRVLMIKIISAAPFIYHFLTLEELRAMVKKAESANIITACHRPGEQGLDGCLTADIDCLEHVYYITQPQVERVKKEDRWVVYILNYALSGQLLSRFSPHDGEGGLRRGEIICRCLSGTTEGEPKLGTGTDEPHQDSAQEACYISGLGAKNRDVLAGITISTARIRGADKGTGSIAEGKTAGFTILGGNPLDDTEASKKVMSVIQDGTIIF